MFLQDELLAKDMVISRIKDAIHKLSNGSKKEKVCALDMLYNLGMMAAEISVAIVQEGALKPINQILVHGNGALKAKAAYALSVLSIDTVNHPSIVEAGLIELLVKLLLTGNDQAAEGACCTLGNISSTKPFVLAVTKAGGVEGIVRHLTSKSELNRKAAVHTCLNITVSQESNTLAAMVKAGAHKQLLQLADSSPLLPSDTQLKALLAITNLILNNVENQVHLVRDGAIKSLVTLATTGPFNQRSEAGKVLFILALQCQHDEQLVKDGAVAALFNLARTIPNTADPSFVIRGTILSLLAHPPSQTILQAVESELNAWNPALFASLANTAQNARYQTMLTKFTRSILPMPFFPMPLPQPPTIWNPVNTAPVSTRATDSSLAGTQTTNPKSPQKSETQTMAVPATTTTTPSKPSRDSNTPALHSNTSSGSASDSPSPSSSSSPSALCASPRASLSVPLDTPISSPSGDAVRKPSEVKASATIKTWQVADVIDWMRGLNLSKEYTQVIEENHVTGLVLQTMTKEDWKEIGVTVFGDVRTLVTSVAELRLS